MGATAGAVLRAGSQQRLVKKILTLIGLKVNGLGLGCRHGADRKTSNDATSTSRMVNLFYGTVAPVNDTDVPSGEGDLFLVMTGNTPSALYRCTVYVASTTATWTQLI